MAVGATTRTYRTGATGIVRIPVDAGVIEIRVAKEGFALVTTSVTVSAGQEQAVVIELLRQPRVEEEITVLAINEGSARLRQHRVGPRATDAAVPHGTRSRKDRSTLSVLPKHVDAWAPVDGRVINAGVRLQFWSSWSRQWLMTLVLLDDFPLPARLA